MKPKQQIDPNAADKLSELDKDGEIVKQRISRLEGLKGTVESERVCHTFGCKEHPNG